MNIDSSMILTRYYFTRNRGTDSINRSRISAMTSMMLLCCSCQYVLLATFWFSKRTMEHPPLVVCRCILHWKWRHLNYLPCEFIGGYCWWFGNPAKNVTPFTTQPTRAAQVLASQCSWILHKGWTGTQPKTTGRNKMQKGTFWMLRWLLQFEDTHIFYWCVTIARIYHTQYVHTYVHIRICIYSV